jgi:hypothetical protein
MKADHYAGDSNLRNGRVPFGQHRSRGKPSQAGQVPQGQMSLRKRFLHHAKRYDWRFLAAICVLAVAVLLAVNLY